MHKMNVRVVQERKRERERERERVRVLYYRERERVRVLYYRERERERESQRFDHSSSNKRSDYKTGLKIKLHLAVK